MLTVKDFCHESRDFLCSSKMYKEVARILNEADKNENILICIITGVGEYFTSGNDLTSFMQVDETETETHNYVE